MPVATIASTAAETYEGWKAIGAVCGPLISGVITLIAINMTNKGHEDRLLKQMKAEDDRKALEREMSMRKEIFFSLAEAIEQKMLFIGRVANLRLDNKNVDDELSLTLKNSAKIYLVGSEQLVRAYTIFNHNYSSNIILLASLRMEAINSFAPLENQQRINQSANGQQPSREMQRKELELEVAFAEKYIALLKGVEQVATKQTILMKDVLIAARQDLNNELRDGVIEEIINMMTEKGAELSRHIHQQIEAQTERARKILAL